VSGAAPAGQFSTIVESKDRTISVRLIGAADMEVKAALEAFLAKLHAEALAGDTAQVIVDFRGLRFLSSSCLKALVGWITTLQALPEQHRYRVVLVSGPEVRWQRHTLRALWALATDIVTIQT
jgi:hypothetical protein